VRVCVGVWTILFCGEVLGFHRIDDIGLPPMARTRWLHYTRLNVRLNAYTYTYTYSHAHTHSHMNG
jgi:hypothetical protein